MIVLSNSVDQTIAPGESAEFDTVILKTGRAECHRPGTGSIKMRCNGVYAVSFSGNIGATAPGVAQLTLRAGGVDLGETVMQSTTAAAGDLNNVSTETRINNCCGDFDRITVVNTGTTEITLGEKPAFVINRVG